MEYAVVVAVLALEQPASSPKNSGSLEKRPPLLVEQKWAEGIGVPASLPHAAEPSSELDRITCCKNACYVSAANDKRFAVLLL